MVTHAFARQHDLLMDHVIIGLLPPSDLTPEEQKEWDELQARPAKLRKRRKHALANILAAKKRQETDDHPDPKVYCAGEKLRALLAFGPSPRSLKERALAGQIVSLQAKVRLALQAKHWPQGREFGLRLDALVREFDGEDQRIKPVWTNMFMKGRSKKRVKKQIKRFIRATEWTQFTDSSILPLFVFVDVKLLAEMVALTKPQALRTCAALVSLYIPLLSLYEVTWSEGSLSDPLAIPVIILNYFGSLYLFEKAAIPHFEQGGF